MQYVLEHIGVSVAAITGVLAARGKQVDLFGVLVIAVVTACGGGTMRDLVIGASPVFWAADAGFLVNAALTAMVMFYLVRFHEPPDLLLVVADAVFLAFFTVIGTRKALQYGMSASVAVAMGVTTGVAGGILRDIILGELPLVFRKGTYIYATAAFFGACLFLTLRTLGVSAQASMIAGVGTVLALRLVGIRWRLTLPILRSRPGGKS